MTTAQPDGVVGIRAIRVSPRQLLVAHLAVVCFGYFLSWYEVGPGNVLMVCGAIVFVLFSYCAWYDGKRQPIWLNPLSCYFFWQAMALGIGAFYQGTQILAGETAYIGARRIIPPEYLEKGYLIGLLGSLALHAGLRWGAPKNEIDSTVPDEQQVRRWLLRLVILFVLGVLAISPVIPMSFGIFKLAFQYGPHAALFAFVLMPKEKLRIGEVNTWLVVLAGTSVLVMTNALWGSSKLLLCIGLLPLANFVMQRRHLRRQVIFAGVLFAFLYLSVIAPVINKARGLAAIYKIGPMESKILAFKMYSPLYTGRLDMEFYDNASKELFGRFFESSSIGYIAAEVDRFGTLDGEGMAFLKYAFIPRILWPDKPWVVQGGQFTTRLGAASNEKEATVANGMEAAGELYWNFGYIGVIVGMVFLGWTFAVLWKMSGSYPLMDTLKMLLYFTTAIGTLNVPEFASRLVSFVMTALFFAALFFLRAPLSGRRSEPLVFRRVAS